ncbi:PIG-L family deacetylase [soil metagenome]
MAAVMAERVIEGEGTAESTWTAWLAEQRVRQLGLSDLVAGGSRLVVVAPHPDDEVLACGAMLSMHARRGGRCVVVAVTDGEASHLESQVWTRERLAVVRRSESTEGIKRLCASDIEFDQLGGADSIPAEVLRLGLPDGEVAARTELLETRLKALLLPGDTVVTTWRLDGHPDHEATARATAAACVAVQCRLVEAPVWMWHWAAPGDARVPWHRLCGLAIDSSALVRKQSALSAHVTQLTERVQSQGAALGPVLGKQIVHRSLRPLEYFFQPESHLATMTPAR